MSENPKDSEIIYAEINYPLLKRTRQKLRMSLESACDGIMNVTDLHTAEVGKSKIPLDVFRNLAHRYGKNINYFFLTNENAKYNEKYWKKINRHLKIGKFLIKKLNFEGEFDS